MSLPDLNSPRRWWVLVAVLSVTLMTPLDASIVNIIISTIRVQFGVGIGAVAWVALAYNIALVGLILPMGRLGDLWGFRRLFLAGTVLFTAASLLCGLAPSLSWLVAARAFQGIGAALIMALSPGIITAVFPAHERGRALGLNGTAIAFGLIIGPTLGGLLAQIGWRWVFYINLPIGIIGWLLCARLLPRLQPSPRRRVDVLGALLALVGLTTLLLGITHAHEWGGWGAPPVLALLVCGALGIGAFLWHERRHPEPMLDLALFRNAVFAGANVAAFMNYLGQTCALFLLPQLLVTVFGYKEWQTGLVMAALPATVLVLAPLSGAWSDRVGSRALSVVGAAINAGGLAALALVAPHQRVAYLVPALLVMGAGTGIFQSPNTSAIMGSVPRTHLGVGGGVVATMRNLGFAVGTAIAGAVVAARGTDTPAFAAGVQAALFLGAAFQVIGAVISALRANAPIAPAPRME
jgi:EmrB/QacA subfamily drug resistance transporter